MVLVGGLGSCVDKPMSWVIELGLGGGGLGSGLT